MSFRKAISANNLEKVKQLLASKADVDLDNIDDFDEFEFVDAFIRSQNAYIPAIRSLPGAYRGWEPGDRARLCIEGLDPDDLRMDYVAVRSQT